MDEHTTPSEPQDSSLTPDQAADVIRFYNAFENKRPRERGWKDKIPLGRSAIHTTQTSHTILPEPDSDKAVLTQPEMKAGLDHIENPPKSDTYYERVDELVDKRNIPYETAKRQADAEGYK